MKLLFLCPCCGSRGLEPEGEGCTYCHGKLCVKPYINPVERVKIDKDDEYSGDPTIFDDIAGL